MPLPPAASSPVSSGAASGDSATSPSLLARVRASEPRAWERLVLLYGPLVACWCRRAGLQETDAADVSQEAFCAVSRRLGEFRARGDGSFRAWLWVVVRSKLMDHFRRAARVGLPEGGTDGHRRLAEIPDDAVPQSWGDPHSDAQTQSTIDEIRRRALELVRAEFEPRTWTAFWRTTIEDQSPRDVAVELEMSVAAVYKSKSRVLARLRAELCEQE